MADFTHLDIKDIPDEDLDEVLKELEALNIQTPLDYEPHPKQLAFHKATQKHRFLCGGNRSGKTEAGTAEDVMHLRGCYPEWFPKENRIETPNRGRVIVTDYAKGGAVFEEKLWKWLPREWVKAVKRTVKGSLERVEVMHVSGGTSTLEIMTHEQDDMVFEGWSGHWAHFDEPPPRGKFVATLRGLIDYSGRVWMTLTPITEPWLYDEYIASDRMADKVAYINVDMRDNPHLPVHEIEEFEANLTEEEKEARIHGKFRHLVGRVYKEFDPAVHCLSNKDFKVGKNWPIYFVTDPHDRKPHFGIWARVDPSGTVYIVNEIKFKGTLKEYAVEVFKREYLMGLKNHNIIRILDPNKGETPTAVTGLKIKEEFAKCGLYFVTTVNDDVAMGHLAVAERLHWNKAKPLSFGNRPMLYFIKESAAESISYMQKYVWDEWKGNTRSNKSAKEAPKDLFKDYPDCIRYLCMFPPSYYEEETESSFQNNDYKPNAITGY